MDDLDNTLKLMELDIYKLSLVEFLEKMQVDIKKGLTHKEALKRRHLEGAHRIQAPIHLPSWICCLLPCLTRLKSMQLFREYLAKEATVLRSSRRIRLDCASLVVGDVVFLQQNDIVPADMRIVQCSNDLLVDISSLISDKSKERQKTASVDSINDHSNLLFMSSIILKGSCTAVVYSTGNKTLWGTLLVNGNWPLSENLEMSPLMNP